MNLRPTPLSKESIAFESNCFVSMMGIFAPTSSLRSSVKMNLVLRLFHILHVPRNSPAKRSKYDSHMGSKENQPPITDSPWLWFALFAFVGLATLLATGGKFKRRQAGIERRGQARIAAAEGTVDTKIDASGRKTTSGMPKYSRPEMTEIGLLPISITVGSVLLVSLGMLARERLSYSSEEKPQIDTDEHG